MEHHLRCNSMKCRRELRDQAILTTCSHVFCPECSNLFQLHDRAGQTRTCPACHVPLPNHEDIALTDLSPTEEYKTSVLSGLSPNTIMECTARALSFWAYQSAQEILYQEHVSKNYASKYATFQTQVDKVLHEANAELAGLRSRLAGMQVDVQDLRQKNEELANVVREKDRKQKQTQELYDKMKRRAMVDQVQDAALEAVDQNIQASTDVNQHTGNANLQRDRAPVLPLFHTQRHNKIHQLGPNKVFPLVSKPPSMSTIATVGAMQPPSQPRYHLPGGRMSTRQAGPKDLQQNMLGTPLLRQRVSPRQTLTDLNNISGTSSLTGYGMSAGLKVSNPLGSSADGLNRHRYTQRVAQRATSGLSGVSNPAFATPAHQNMFSNGNSYH